MYLPNCVSCGKENPASCQFAHAQIPLFDAKLPSLAATRTAAGQRVSFVDIDGEANFEPEDHWTCGVHFNTSGWFKMAEVWAKHLGPLLPTMDSVPWPPHQEQAPRAIGG